MGITILVSAMGLLWVVGLEDKFWLFTFFIVFMIYVHFCGGI
jgi:hypothetical protein